MSVRAKVTLRLPGLRQPMALPVRSLLVRIGTLDDDRPHLRGVEIDAVERVTLHPGDDEVPAVVEFWYEDADRYVRPGVEYRLGYGVTSGSSSSVKCWRSGLGQGRGEAGAEGRG
ncbi:hypothetical protein HII36_15950 [Nonomuraea sp. NN258]|uniref:hypothetical protein n=1 Tax=Nonomuraea antri TaxID=2730852 RepID=UPI0015690604|nr:hypothetical protein [Nonomuraea antri]NRQ33329.1 hypothetical protein [Nonomuraea antri]